MKLMTQKVTKSIPKLYSQENNPDPMCVLKFFTPDAQWTWYITEGEEQEDGDWLFFGKVVSPIVPEGELGYSSLNELKKVRGALGLPIERDMHWNPKPLSECKY